MIFILSFSLTISFEFDIVLINDNNRTKGLKMNRIKAEIKKAENTPYSGSKGDLELGLAVRIAYECTDHCKDRHEFLAEAIFEKIVQDLGHAAAKAIFANMVEK